MREIQPHSTDQPIDTVSQIVWDQYREDSFLCSSWDGYLRYYIIVQSTEVKKAWQIFLEHPILCCDIGPNNVVFAGLCTGHILGISM
jgi:hypothetical protein